MKPTYEELEAKCLLQQNKLDAINKLMGVIEGASDLAKSGIEKLEQQLAAVVAENAGLKAQEPKAWYIRITDEVTTDSAEAKMWRGVPLVPVDVQTPATDAYLAEVRAQAVEIFAERKHSEMMSLHPDTHAVGSIASAMSAEVKELREFAAQLRQGAAL